MKSTADKVWLVTAIVAALAGGVVSFSLRNEQGTVTPSVPAPTNGSVTDRAETQVQVYWLNDQGDQLVAVNQVVRQKSRSDSLRKGLEALITGPAPQPNLLSAIPKNTRVLGLTIEGSAIRVNLSREFGEGGGSSSIQGRLVQVLYTLTSLDPNAGVFLAIEGKPLEYLGGEGIEVRQPMYRRDYAHIFR